MWVTKSPARSLCGTPSATGSTSSAPTRPRSLGLGTPCTDRTPGMRRTSQTCRVWGGLWRAVRGAAARRGGTCGPVCAPAPQTAGPRSAPTRPRADEPPNHDPNRGSEALECNRHHQRSSSRQREDAALLWATMAPPFLLPPPPRWFDLIYFSRFVLQELVVRLWACWGC